MQPLTGWTGRTHRLMWTDQKYRPVRVKMTSLALGLSGGKAAAVVELNMLTLSEKFMAAVRRADVRRLLLAF